MNRCSSCAQNQFDAIDGNQPQHKEIIARFINKAGARRNAAHKVISTGFTKLDDYVGGFRPGELTVLASRPDAGKSLLALQFAYNAALHGAKVMYFALEIGASELALYLLSQRSHVPLRALRQDSDLEERQIAALISAVDESKGCDIRFYDTPGLSISEIESMIKASVISSTCAGVRH